jgi:uncharacterized protein YlaN (UPF0358 family)
VWRGGIALPTPVKGRLSERLKLSKSRAAVQLLEHLKIVCVQCPVYSVVLMKQHFCLCSQMYFSIFLCFFLIENEEDITILYE